MTLTHLDLDRIDGLAGRLRKLSTIDFGGSAAGMAVEAMSEAASDLTAMIAYARELEGALEPFAAVADEYFNDWCPDETPAWYRSVDGFDDASDVSVGDFRRARTALQRKTP